MPEMEIFDRAFRDATGGSQVVMVNHGLSPSTDCGSRPGMASHNGPAWGQCRRVAGQCSARWRWRALDMNTPSKVPIVRIPAANRISKDMMAIGGSEDPAAVPATAAVAEKPR